MMAHLQTLATERGMSRRALSDASGLPTSTVSHLLIGRMPAQLEQLMMLCSALGVSPDRVVAYGLAHPLTDDEAALWRATGSLDAVAAIRRLAETRRSDERTGATRAAKGSS